MANTTLGSRPPLAPIGTLRSGGGGSTLYNTSGTDKNGKKSNLSPIRATSPEDADAERTARQMEIEQLLGGLSVGLGGTATSLTSSAQTLAERRSLRKLQAKDRGAGSLTPHGGFGSTSTSTATTPHGLFQAQMAEELASGTIGNDTHMGVTAGTGGGIAAATMKALNSLSAMQPHEELYRAEWKYDAKAADELTFKWGDFIYIDTTRCDPNGWWYGRLAANADASADNSALDGVGNNGGGGSGNGGDGDGGGGGGGAVDGGVGEGGGGGKSGGLIPQNYITPYIDPRVGGGASMMMPPAPSLPIGMTTGANIARTVAFNATTDSLPSFTTTAGVSTQQGMNQVLRGDHDDTSGAGAGAGAASSSPLAQGATGAVPASLWTGTTADEQQHHELPMGGPPADALHAAAAKGGGEAPKADIVTRAKEAAANRSSVKNSASDVLAAARAALRNARKATKQRLSGAKIGVLPT